MRILSRLPININYVRRITSSIAKVVKKELVNAMESNHADESVVSTHDKPVILDPFKPVGLEEHSFLNDIRPSSKKSYNFAAYINQSKTLQKMIRARVSLYDIENIHQKDSGYLTLLDFDKDCRKYIRFLRRVGVEPGMIGKFITIYPTIFKEPIENLEIRINFLKSEGFTQKMISLILNGCPYILSQKTVFLKDQFKQLQIEFKLSDDELRTVMINDPEAIVFPRDQFRLIKATLADEFGFEEEEVINIVVQNPTVLKIPRPVLIRKLDLLHNTVGYSQNLLSKLPKIITAPKIEIRNRFEFLKKLKRNQFNCNEPRYVPPEALYNCSVERFCSKYAKESLDEYKSFLKSM